MADSRSVVGAIADGSQAIAHDGFDVETFEQAADDYARLARTVGETAGTILTGPALLRDLFWSLLTVAQQQEMLRLLVSASRALINTLKNSVGNEEASDE